MRARSCSSLRPRDLVGAVVFLLAWIMLDGLCLAFLRRPTVAALISLEVLLALTLLSRFKFDKLWMTIDFVDVMIVDRDTTAFLLTVFPALRWWIMLGGGGDDGRDRPAGRSIPSDQAKSQPRLVHGFGRGAGHGVAALAHGADRGLRGSQLCLQIFSTGVEAVRELSTHGYLDVAEGAPNIRARPGTACGCPKTAAHHPAAR